MTGHRKFSELSGRMSPESRERAQISLAEQIAAVWEAQDAPAIEAAQHRLTMTGLTPRSGLWNRNKLRAERADRQRAALLAAHATLLRLAAIENGEGGLS